MDSGYITIKDIAKKLGVSVTTVSRALRDHPDVNAETRKLILEIANELDYQPNTIAQNLVKKKSNTIGIIIPGLIINFYASAISGIQKKASESGYNIVISQSNESYELELANINTLISNRVDGLIISVSSETKNTDHIKKIIDRHIPVVLINRDVEEVNADKVIIDDFEGAYYAVSHLISEGCTRIAHIAGPRHLSTAVNRYKGYAKALMDHGIPLREELVSYNNLSKEDGINMLKSLIKQKEVPDAIFAFNDATAMGTIKALHELGLKIPRDIALAGFSNEPLAELIEPSLTTVEQPTFELGLHAAEMLIKRINNKDENLSPRLKVLKPKLIIRKSSQKKVFSCSD